MQFVVSIDMKPFLLIAFAVYLQNKSKINYMYNYKFNDLFDYRVLDIPSMALACGYFPKATDFNANLATLLEVQPETNDPLNHTGESGVNFNYALLKSLMNQGCFSYN